MPHEIHGSERKSFRGCRRRWDWAYREGFVPLGQPKPLEFGIAYHMAMEAFYAPETWSTTTPEEKAHAAIEVFKAECIRQRDAYLKNMKISSLSDFEMDEYNDRIDLGAGMMAYYATKVHPNYDDWFRPVHNEIPFSVPLKDPRYEGNIPLRCTNSPQCGQAHSNDIHNDDSIVVYSGRVDMLVEDKRYGGYFIWDHKTAAAIETSDEFLQLDDQVGGYVWALREKLGLDVRGFIYQQVRKDWPREPKMLKRQSSGRSFSIDKNQPTNAEIYIPFIKRNDKIAYEDGKYDEFFNYLISPDATVFHKRFIVQKSKYELDETGRNIALEAADMVDPDLRMYPSIGRFSCKSCAYREPCVNKNLGEDYQHALETNFLQTNRRYWMDEPKSSDKENK